MDISQALATGKGLSLSEALGMGGLVTGLGMTIVFAVLIILMIVLMLFKVIFYKEPKKAEDNAAEAAVEAEVQSVSSEPDNDELIAVLTAAVAASLNTSTYNLRIKSYRRVENKKSAWNRAGINETINNRF